MSIGIRTLEHLQDAMSNEFVWRKKELHRLKSMVVANETGPDRDLFVRAAVTLLYAHWEGAVRQLAGFYLEFVARKKLRHSELPDAFLAMAIRKLVHRAVESSKVETGLNLVNFFRAEMAKASDLNWKTGINTKSNLKSATFREIVLSLGLNYGQFATKEHLIDEKLLANRNQIAHGKDCFVDFDEYLELHDEVIGMMQDLYNQIENSAFTNAFRKIAVHGLPSS
jgi:hypothetical protein